MRSADSSEDFNESHKRHLVSSCQHADKLLGEIESILSAANSRSPFPKYKGDLAPAQSKVVQDYLARIRAQMLRVLQTQGIRLPGPEFSSIHSIRITLTFVRIAFEECTAGRMRGYGEVPQSKVPELNGLVGEMTGMVEQLDRYLAQGLGQDLRKRLERLEQTGNEIELVKTLERIIAAHRFVEFRSALSMIVECLESQSFEMALFGRVNSGKSSLLNYIVQSEVLPVGVNPITAVPTRLAYGPEPKLTVWFAHKNPEQVEISRLPEFVTEQLNPANSRHVARITVELPSPRLRDGVVLVDTPGLGSLATSGAVETLAYLPRCDLGVMLIDAGSTLTQDDLSTIRGLYEAGVPASVLLSKADLLAPEDQARASKYTSEQIRSHLDLNLSVRPVSVKKEHAVLLDRWLNEEILPLYDQHQQLAQESLRRKIGALTESVETALKVSLERPSQALTEDVDTNLRRAAGRFEETRKICLNATDQIRNLGDASLSAAASRVVEQWVRNSAAHSPAEPVVTDTIAHVAAERAGAIYEALETLAKELARALHSAANALQLQDAPPEEELTSVLKEMPRMDLGTIRLNLRPNLLLRIWKSMATRQVENELRTQIGAAVSEAFSSYGRVLEAWVRRTLADLQRRFDAHADGYRAHVDRLTIDKAATPLAKDAIRRDLESLARQEVSGDVSGQFV